VQLCLLIAGVAMARLFTAHKIVPAMVAGLSIGAYPAAVVAGVLSFVDAVRMVRRRAQLMEQAYPHGFGMSAINGLGRIELDNIISAIHSADAPVYLANLNGPKQLVIAGSKSAMQLVIQRALELGAAKAIPLAVNVPSHCPLFDSSAQQLQDAFAEIAVGAPRSVYLSANAARAMFDPQQIKLDLTSNMAKQVHWADTLRLAWERGARLAIEMPSGTVLSKLATTQWPEGVALACDNSRLDTLLALAQREQMR
jgi:malonate decarboxylase epsilon subunit